MSRKAIIIWGVVIIVAIIGIIITSILLNNGSSDSNSNNSPTEDNKNNNVNTSDLPTKSEIVSIEAGQGSDDYYYWSIMPLRLQSQLPNPRSSSTIDHYYSKELGIAFSYEVISLVDKDKFLAITPPEDRSNDTTIYLHNFEETKESGQSIEIIDIEDNLRFNTIPEIINLQVLDEKQRELCRIEEQNNRYSIIAKDIKVKDSTPICGKYAKGNNRFFIKPRQEGSSITKLIFVSAGSQELSYDGTMQGQYWYESVLVE
ncbi:MAG: hypothetical protein RJB24_27 [Candidatus Parcubacteria bacterium]|jgi:hypothetical protein